MMGDAGWRKGLQTTPPTILGWWFNYRNRGGPCWRGYVTCCRCRRGGGAQGNARPQAGLAGIQPRWHRSEADRRAEPPPQMLSCCRQLPAGHRCASHPPQAALPCFAFALHHRCQFCPTGRARRDTEVRNLDPAWPFPKRKLQSWCPVGSA